MTAVVRTRSFLFAVLLTAAVSTGLAISLIQNDLLWLGVIVLGVACTAWFVSGMTMGVVATTSAFKKER